MSRRMTRGPIRVLSSFTCREWLLRDIPDRRTRRALRVSLRSDPSAAELIYPQLYLPRQERQRFLSELAVPLDQGDSLEAAYFAALGLHVCLPNRVAH